MIWCSSGIGETSTTILLQLLFLQPVFFLGILDCKKLVIVMIWIRQATPALAIDTATFLRQHHL